MKRKPKILLAAAGTVAAGFGALAPRALDEQIAPRILAERDQKVDEAAGALSRHREARPLFAGWAAVPLPLPEGVPLAGYGARRGAGSTAVHDPLFARALCLQTEDFRAVVLSVDLLLVNPALAGAVRLRLAEELRATPTLVHFTATHTHSGPGGWGEMFLEESVTGSYDSGYFRDLAATLAEAARQAMAATEPSSLGILTLEAPDLLRNRTVDDGPVDPVLEAIVVKRTEGAGDEPAQPAGLIVIYGAHPTCLPAANLEISGDYPGALVAALESEETIEFAAFAAGVVGSHAPRPPIEGSPFESAASIGNTLAARIVERLPEVALASTVALDGAQFICPMPPLQFRVADSRRLPTWIAGSLHPAEGLFSCLRLDDHVWIGMPVELSGMISPALRDRARQLGLALTLTCFNGDYLGYVIPDSLYGDATLYEARMNFLGPRGGSFIEETLTRLITKAAASSRTPAVPNPAAAPTGERTGQ